MLAYTYIEHGRFGLLDKPKARIEGLSRRYCPRDTW